MKKTFKIFLFLLLNTLMFLGCFELIARCIFVNEDKTLYIKKDELFISDKVLGYKLKPFFNIEGKKNKLYPGVSIKINSHGFRMGEFDMRDKIALFGDSVVFGFGIDSKDTISEKLTLKLEKKYQLINAGVPGYNTEQIVSSCKILKNKINLKKVILFVNANDYYTRYYPICGGATVTRSKSLPWEDDLIDESQINQTRAKTLFFPIIFNNLVKKKSIYTSLSKTSFPETDEVESLYKNVLQLIKYWNSNSLEVNKLKKRSLSLLKNEILLLESSSIPVIVVFFPFRISACKKTVGKDQRFEDIAYILKKNTKADIILLKNILTNSSDWLPSDEHPSINGTEKIANVLHQKLKN